MTADASPAEPAAAAETTPPLPVVIGVSIVLGAVIGLMFLGFEWVVNHGDTWIWDDVFNTGEERWVVVPLAIGLSIIYSFIVHLVGQRRIIPIQLSIVEDLGKPLERAPLSGVAVILVVGAASLLAGASLGPEAALAAGSIALGTWCAFRFNFGSAGELLVLTALTALLVAFFGSLVPLLIPPLILFQRTRKIPIPALIPPTLAGLAAYGTVYLIRGDVQGYGSIPSGTSANAEDYLIALALGICGVGVGYGMRTAIKLLTGPAKQIGERVHWAWAAAIFGLVLGILYLIGGPTIEFSGSEGSKMLVNDTAYGTAALAGIVVMKLLATGWSLSAGYRGGLVFPSVFAGVALSMFVASLFGDTAGPGLMIGSIAGVLVEMTSPALGVIMLLSLVPSELLPLALAGAAGAILPHVIKSRLHPKPPEPASA